MIPTHISPHHIIFSSSPLFAMSSTKSSTSNQPSSWTKSTLHTASHRGRAFPDPSDRSACAHFRLRQKASKTRPSRHAPSSASDISQLWDATLDLNRRLNHLYETVLEQAINFRDHLAHHLSSCTVPPNVSVPLVSALPSECGSHQSTGAATSNVNVPAYAPDVCPPHESLPDVSVHVDNPTPSVPLPGVTVDHQAEITEMHTSRSSLSSTLPRLRGLFNKPRKKASDKGSASLGCSSTKLG